MTLRASILAILGISVLTSSAHAADLLEVYQKALQADPQIREAEATKLATMEAKPQARAGLLPQLTAGGSIERSDQDINRTQLTAIVDENGVPTDVLVPVNINVKSKPTSSQYQVRLTQSIFRWDRWSALRRADKQVAQAEVDYKAAQQDLLSRVAQRYFDVLAAEDTLKAAQANMEAFARQLDQADKRFEVGLIAITDVQEARAARDQASADVIAAKRSLSTAQEFLREITGGEVADLAEPKDDIPLQAPAPADEEKWVAAALDQNLSVLSARLATDIAREDINAARSGHLPSIDLYAQRTGSTDRGDQVSRRGDSPGTRSPADGDTTIDSIGVQVTFPIYSGGAVSSEVRQRVYQHRAARERSERVARDTEREARDAYLGVLSEISRVQALRQALESSQTALQATEAGFEVGTRTTVDVLDARRRLFEAQTNYYRSRYDYILNVLRLKLAAGSLSVEDLQEVNGWLAH
jgi:outer membrane protein